MTWPHEEIFHRYPIPDNHVIDDAGYDDILARLRSELNSGRTVTSTAGEGVVAPRRSWDAGLSSRDSITTRRSLD